MDDLWTTKDGREVAVPDMETSHIRNCIRMLKRKGFVAPSTVEAVMSCSEPSGEAAQDLFFQELRAICRAPRTHFLDLFDIELAQRGEKTDGV